MSIDSSTIKNNDDEKEQFQEDIKELLKNGIEKEETLFQMKQSILKRWKRVYFTSIEETYIHHKYVKYCLIQWFDELPIFFNKLSDEKLKDFLSQVIKTRNLHEIPSECSDSKYFRPILQHIELLSKNQCDSILINFKQCVSNYLHQKSSQDAEENEFAIEVMKLFSLYNIHEKSMKNQIQSIDYIDRFLQTLIPFDQFAKRFVAEFTLKNCEEQSSINENLRNLKMKLSEWLEINDKVSANLNLEEIRTIIAYSLTSITYKTSSIENRTILTVQGVYISFSEIVKRLEKQIQQSNAVEVWIIAIEILFIDCDFTGSIWHGKNLAIRAKDIQVILDSTIDVSGVHGKPQTKPETAKKGEQNGNEEKRNGEHGMNGEKGESGGNVLIVAERIESADRCTIKSNGGNGSYGQDGGDGVEGKNGQDGYGLTLEQFKSDFPEVAKFHEKTAGYRATQTFEYIENICTADSVTSKKWGSNGVLNCYYIEGKTERGNQIYFSFYWLPLNKEAFCLYQGTTGQPGQPGGFGGLGGFAGPVGFAGDIQMIIKSSTDQKKIQTIALNGRLGEDGKDGKDGKAGKAGENRPDVGYIDYHFWKEAVYYEPNWYRLQSFTSSNSNRIRSSQYENKDEYIAIVQREKPDPPSCLSMNDEAKRRHQHRRENKKEATRKHAISNQDLNNAFVNYQSQFDNNSMENLQLEIDQFHEQSSQIQSEENNFEREKISIVKPLICDKHHRINKRSNKTTFSPNVSDPFQRFLQLWQQFINNSTKKTEQTTVKINELIQVLKESSFSYENTYKLLLSVERDLDGPILENIKLKFHLSNHDHLNQLKSLIIDKLRFALLERISSRIDNRNRDEIETMEEYVEEETKSDNDSGLHAIVGEKNEFSFYQSSDGQMIREKISNQLPQLIKENRELIPLINQSISVIVENCTDRQKYPQMRQYLLGNHQNPISKLLIEYGKYLTDDYSSFNKYDIAIIAYHQKISLHIHIFSDTDENSLRLFANYNNNGKEVRHVLFSKNRFIKLSVEKVEKKMSRCLRYVAIIDNVQRLNKREEFEEYLQNEIFRSNEISPKTKNETEDKIDQNQIIQEISEYFPLQLQQKVRLALKPLVAEFPSNKKFFQALKQRFSLENPLISSEILMFLSMSLMKKIHSKTNEILYQWIILAYPQNQWIDELALIQLEEVIEKSYEKLSYLRSILRQISSESIICLLFTKLFEIDRKNEKRFDLLKLLEQMTKVHFKDEDFLDLFVHLPLNQWSIKLQHLKFIQLVENSIQHSTIDEQFTTLLYYLYSLHSKSQLLFQRFLGICQAKQLKCQQIENLTEKFVQGHWDFNVKTLNVIAKTPDKQLDIVNPKKKGVFKRMWNYLFVDNERKFDQLRQIIKDDKYTLNEDQLNQIDQFFKTMTKKSIKNMTIEDIQQWSEQFQNQTHEKKLNNLHQVLLIIERAITLFFPEIKALRDAQKLTIIAFILNKKNLLAQVATGEGKSLIVASIMIVKCLLGGKGDIITSSPILAERDAKQNERLYQVFGISVAHNASENLQQRRSAYEKRVVYGDVSSFQRDYLLDHFYGKRILGDRYEQGRTNILVDEVDSMLLDKGNCVLYLSHQPPSLDTIESIFVYIWQLIIVNLTQGQSSSLGELRRAILNNLSPTLNRQDLLILTIKQDLLDRLWNELIDRDIINNEGEILSCDIQFDDEDLQVYHRDLRYLLQEISDQERQIEVPNYLKPFIKQHLNAWISSALKALEMEEGRNYILDVDRTATKFNKHPNIIIIDCDTGVDQNHSQWNEGLHQFLQLKHQCKTSLLNLKAVFISNITFFKMYKNIYGLSGTLGSESEREFLKITYDVDFLTVPVALPSRFQEYLPILCQDRRQWREKLLEEAKNMSKNRSVLIICETIQDVEQLHQAFRSQKNFSSEQLFVYKRSYEEFSIEQQGLSPRQIIIATNLAGRGTDIKITEELNNNGGLHVILSYLPENYRIEQQAFGRTARKGQNGSGQLIFFDQWTNEFNARLSSLHVIDLKNERDYNELCRVGDIRQFYEISIQFEERLFQRYHQAYDRLQEKLERIWIVNEQIKEIVLNSLINRWAFWLDEMSPMINQRSRLVSSLDRWIQQLDHFKSLQDTIERLVTEPSQLIKLGKIYAKEKDYRQASKLFDQVIRQEPNFAHAAYYYQAHCLVKMTALNTEKDRFAFHRSLDRAEYLFQRQIDLLTRRTMIVSQVNLTNEQQSNISFVTIDSYRIQNENLCHLYSNFIRSIYNIRGYAITPDTFLSVDIDPGLAWKLYEKFFQSNEKIFIKKKFNQHFDLHALRNICIDYQLNEEDLKNYLSRSESITEEVMKNYWKEKQLPTREDFWQWMIEKKILTDIKEISIIPSIKLENKNELFETFLKKFEKKFQPITTLQSKDKTRLFLQQLDLENPDIQYLSQSIDQKYSILEKQKLIIVNQIGRLNIQRLRDTTLEKYQSVQMKNFLEIPNLTNNDCQQIYTQLTEENLIEKKTGKLIHLNFQSVNLTQYQLYKPRIISIVNLRCLYQIERLSLLHQYDSTDINEIRLTLPLNPFRELLYQLESVLIIKPIYFNYHVINISLFDKFLARDYSSELEKYLKTQIKEDTAVVQSFTKSLQGTIGKLNYLSKPDSFLNELEEDSQDKFERIEELDQFTINGLDHLLDIMEKKWTWTMLISTAMIFIFGIAQIVGGVFLELYSMGIGTHVANGLIAEGLSDIFYAVSAAKNGYFSWSDYLLHKIKSIAITVAIMGVSALLSRGIRFSRFGAKLVGDTGKLAQISGRELLAAAGKQGLADVGNKVMKHVAVRIGKKLAEGVAFSLTNASISLLSENILKGYCGKIVGELLISIRQSIEEKKQRIRDALKNMYHVYGTTMTQKWLAEINETNATETWLSTITRWVQAIVQVIVGGISQAVRKINQANQANKFTEIAENLMVIYSAAMKVQAYGKAMWNIRSDTKTYIDERIKKLETKMKEAQNETKYKEEQMSDDQINGLIDRTTEEWTERLQSKIDNDIRTRIIEPLLNEGAQAILKKTGKLIQKYHHNRKDQQLLKQFEKVRGEYREKEKNILDQNENNADRQEVLQKIDNQYNQCLLVLMAKTRNPNLVASIIEEGGPMDIVCLQAMANITGQPIQITNADGTTIPQSISPQNGLNQNDGKPILIEFISGDGVNTFGHFLPAGGAAETTANPNDNNCLIYATLGPDVTSTAQNIRQQIANEIRSNQYIAYIIQKGYHRYYLSQLSFGGQRNSSVDQLKNILLDRKIIDEQLIGTTGVHGNGYSYGTTCLSKENERESEHLLPKELAHLLHQVMYAQQAIDNKLPEIRKNPIANAKLFDDFMKSGLPLTQLNNLLMDEKDMLTICIPYDAHHDPNHNWTSFKIKNEQKWKLAETLILAYRSKDNNQNDKLFDLLIGQYENLLKDPRYPRIKQGFSLYLEASESRGYINTSQKEQLLTRWNLPITSTEQFHQIPPNYEHRAILDEVLQKSLLTKPVNHQMRKRYSSTLL